MAYITKEQVKQKAINLKKIAAKYGVKISVSGSNSSSLTVTLISGRIDFIKNFQEVAGRDRVSQPIYARAYVNPYHYQTHFDGIALAFLNEIFTEMKVGWYNRSDAMTDYFDTAWYNHINVGTDKKPYVFVG